MGDIKRSRLSKLFKQGKQFRDFQPNEILDFLFKHYTMDHFWTSLIDLLCRMLSRDPLERPSAHSAWEDIITILRDTWGVLHPHCECPVPSPLTENESSDSEASVDDYGPKGFHLLI